jgi:hypothetical protein
MIVGGRLADFVNDVARNSFAIGADSREQPVGSLRSEDEIGGFLEIRPERPVARDVAMCHERHHRQAGDARLSHFDRRKRTIRLLLAGEPTQRAFDGGIDLAPLGAREHVGRRVRGFARLILLYEFARLLCLLRVDGSAD